MARLWCLDRQAAAAPGGRPLFEWGSLRSPDPSGALYKGTACHNTITVGGRDQHGGLIAYDTAITDFRSTSGDRCPGDPAGVDWVTADATAVYDRARRVRRHVVFLRPCVVLLLDDVESERPEEVWLNFTVLGPLRMEGNRAVSETARNRLTLATVADHAVSTETSLLGTHWSTVPSYRLGRRLPSARRAAPLTVLAAAPRRLRRRRGLRRVSEGEVARLGALRRSLRRRSRCRHGGTPAPAGCAGAHLHNILYQEADRELMPALHERGMGVIVKRPIANAAYLRAERPATSFGESWDLAQRLGLRELAGEMPLVEFALRYTLSRADVSTAIVGTTDPGHLRANALISDGNPLPADTLARIRDAYDARFRG